MLAGAHLIAFVPTRDADRARVFYERTLGLRFVSDDAFALVFDANGTMLRVVRAPEFTPLPFTLLGWGVPDVQSAVATLAAQGVEFHQYGLPGQTAAGIWTAPGGSAKVAWFSDPDGNVLSLSQH